MNYIILEKIDHFILLGAELNLVFSWFTYTQENSEIIGTHILEKKKNT